MQRRSLVASAILSASLAACATADVAPPSASVVPTASPAPSFSPPTEPTSKELPESTVAITDLTWREAGSFGESGETAVVNDIILTARGLVAVGVLYKGGLPIFGPSPFHEGRIWTSPDGTTWADSTPEGIFANTNLRQVFVTGDGSLITIGLQSEPTPDSGPESVYPVRYATWESHDGVAWRTAMSGLPVTAQGFSVEHGGRGYLALVVSTGATSVSELWSSPDGRAWEQVRTLAEGSFAIAAGTEGFVVSGRLGSPAEREQEPFVIASGDGREWFESASPPTDVAGVAPLEGDWIAMSYTLGEDSPAAIQTWFSANGLDWTVHGQAAVESVPIEGASCDEHLSGLTAGGSWLVLGTTLSYPCSEGGFVVHGTQRISGDGTSWVALPFERGTPGIGGSGSAVYASASVGGRLVLVGEANHRATFWIGEPP
jgi:hypothetical protein